MAREQQPTIAMIARESGFSRSTVGHVLNNRHRDLRISPVTAEHVQRVARRCGYRPNPLSRGLLNKGTRSIGVLWSASGPHESYTVIRGITDQIRARGYSSYFTDHRSDPVLARAALEDFLLRRADAVVMHASFDAPLAGADRDLLLAFDAALVVTDDPWTEVCASIFYDQAAALVELGGYWRAAGRRRIAFVGPQPGNRRKAEALHATLEQGGGATVDILDTGSGDPASFAAVLERRYSARRPYDAVACSTDEGALAVLGALRRMGLAVPGDIALAGFNNNLFTAFTDVPLASVDRSTEALAATIAGRLFDQLDGRQAETPEPARVPMRFVWRESAGAPPPGAGATNGGMI